MEKEKHTTEFMDFSVNDVVQHKTFGVGKIVGVEGLGANQKLSIDFQNKLSKELLNKYANLKLLVS